MAMSSELVTEVTALQIPSQPAERHGNVIVLATGPILLKTDHQPPHVGASTQGCKTAAVPHGCWSVEVKVAIVLIALAGLLILALFYRVLLLRHKLRTAQARNALEYFGFYHMAQYNLKQVDLPSAMNPVGSPPLNDLQAPSESLPSALDVPPSPAAIPPLLSLPPPPPPAPPSLPPPHPIIYTTPPSPMTDAEVYSHIGALRPSRLSGMSQMQVVLFEHSSL